MAVFAFEIVEGAYVSGYERYIIYTVFCGMVAFVSAGCAFFFEYKDENLEKCLPKNKKDSLIMK